MKIVKVVKLVIVYNKSSSLQKMYEEGATSGVMLRKKKDECLTLLRKQYFEKFVL